MEKIYINKELSDCLIEQNANLEKDDNGYYINGWTQGVAEIDITNTDNCATYLCWYENNNPVGIKAYFYQFRRAEKI